MSKILQSINSVSSAVTFMLHALIVILNIDISKTVSIIVTIIIVFAMCTVVISIFLKEKETLQKAIYTLVFVLGIGFVGDHNFLMHEQIILIIATTSILCAVAVGFAYIFVKEILKKGVKNK